METLTLGGASEVGSGAEERRSLFLSPAPPEDFFISLSLCYPTLSLSPIFLTFYSQLSSIFDSSYNVQKENLQI